MRAYSSVKYSDLNTIERLVACIDDLLINIERYKKMDKKIGPARDDIRHTRIWHSIVKAYKIRNFIDNLMIRFPKKSGISKELGNFYDLVKADLKAFLSAMNSFCEVISSMQEVDNIVRYGRVDEHVQGVLDRMKSTTKQYLIIRDRFFKAHGELLQFIKSSDMPIVRRFNNR